MRAYVCEVEDYNGNKTPYRVFAMNADKAREKLVKLFPKCYVAEAVYFTEYATNKANKGKNIKMI
jgi:hypothetical protein